MNAPFTVSPGRLEDAIGHACHVANEGQIVVNGSFAIKCSKFSIGPVTPAEGIIWTSPPSDNTRSLFMITLSGGSSVLLTLSAPAEIWPHGGNLPAGSSTIVGTYPFVKVGPSRAMFAFPEALSCATRTDAVPSGTQKWIQTVPVAGQPGCLLGRANKLATAQGINAYNSLVVPATPQPVYVMLTIAPPALPSADGTAYPCNPIYFAFRATDLLPPAVMGAPGFGVKMGDLMALTGTMPLVFCIDHLVSNVGFWLPTAEEVTPGVGNVYMAISMAVYTLEAKRLLPMGGLSLVPPGVAPATIPSQFFCEQEVRLGA